MPKDERLEQMYYDRKEQEFCIVVLQKAKEIFGKDADKLDRNKMVQLCCFVADDIGFPLTRGWCR